MRTIQEKYNAILEGKFSKSQFVKDAKRELSQFLSPFNGYEDTVSILKSKGVIYEAKKQEVPEYDKPTPGYSIEALERAVDYELEGMGLMSQETISEEDYAKAKKKAEKNLKKDSNYYLHLLSGDSKKVDKHDQMVPVKKNNHVDTFNGLKKAELKEAAMAKGFTEEQIEAALKSLKEKKKSLYEYDQADAVADYIKDFYRNPDTGESIIDDETINDFYRTHPEWEEQADGSDEGMQAVLDNFKEFLSVNTDYVDEKKGKDHDGDGDIDGDDYMAAKDKAIKKAMGKEVNERVGALQDFISLIQDRAEDSGFPEEEEAEEVVYAIGDHYNFGVDILHGPKDVVNEGRRRKMKGGKVVTENDYETGGYVESMGPMLDKVLKQLIAVWDEWKEGPATEPGMVPFAKKDLLSYIDSQINEGEDIVEDTVEKHKEIKEAFKAIISKVLQEEVITEAATGNLSKIASQYNDFEGFQAAINDLENIVTDVESYYAKTKDKIQKVYDSFKDIKNTEGLAVGAMLGPAIEAAFRKDLMPVTEKGFTKGLEMPKVKMLETDEIAEEELEEKETVFKPVTEEKKYKYTKKRILSELAAEDLELKSLAKRIIPVIKKYKVGVEYVTDQNAFNIKATPSDDKFSAGHNEKAKLLIKDGMITIAIYYIPLARYIDSSGVDVLEKAKKAASMLFKDVREFLSKEGDSFEMKTGDQTKNGYAVIKIRQKQ